MKHERYVEQDFAGTPVGLRIDRRELLGLVGGGILILFSSGDPHAEAQEGGRRRGQSLPEDFNAFLRIGGDGRVTCFTGKIEMGQGVVTSLAQMLADELDVPPESVDMVMGDTDLCPWDMGTFGSMTTRFFGPPLRAAGAEARRVLLELAAERLGVPAEQLTVEGGVVSVGADPAKHVSYAELAQGKSIERHVTPRPAVKQPAEFKVISHPETRRDARVKVTGEAQYAADIRRPGMLHAKVLRPPAHGATLGDVDLSGVDGVAGARAVRDGDLVAVLHERPDEAQRALATVKATYQKPEPEVDDTTIFDHLLKVAPAGQPVAQEGDLKQGEGRSADVFEETYLNSYVAHSPMEPHAALAEIDGEKATVWASTQNPFGLRDEVARALSLPGANVRVITPFVGGGFGGKTHNLQAVEAARLAKLAGKPVQVSWTREEEFFEDTFRPAAVVKIRSGITAEGLIAFWDYHVYYAGQRGADRLYNIPDYSIQAHGSAWGGEPGAHPFGTGAWRAPGNNTNTFARESQVDIMAAKAGIDPLEFRLKNLQDAKLQGVLKAAAEKFGWTGAKAPSGRGYGVACGTDAGTSVATMVEVAVDKATGRVQVKRVVAAQNMGLAINPEGATIQMEGCITMGLGYALTEEIHFKGGDVLDRNYGSYEIPRFSWLPNIETVIIDDRESPAQGGGEPAIITMGAVIANAIHDATGARLLQLPMTPQRVKEALAKG